MCSVSPSWINSRESACAFAAHSQTTGGYIRDSRLLACRSDLLNSLLRHKTITEISMRWGFADPAYFCRAYKLRFGHPPSADRSLLNPLADR